MDAVQQNSRVRFGNAAEQRHNNYGRIDYSTQARIEDALRHIPADDRELWVRIGMAIKSELGDSGFSLWNNWSQSSEKYNRRDAIDVWRSIDPNGGITIGTLFYEARQHGWRDDHHREPTTRHQDGAEAERREREEEQQRRRKEAANLALKVWKAAQPVGSEHPYLKRKGVSPTNTLREIGADHLAELIGYIPKSKGEPLAGRILVVPIKIGESVSSIEFIDESGRKSALAGALKAGGFWVTGALPADDDKGLTLLVAEGVATTLSASEATGLPGVAALSNGNLLSVTKAMRERYPKAELVILADLSKETGEPDKHAIEVARVTGARLAVPPFTPDEARQGQKDINDLHQARGIEAVRKCIEAAVRPEETVIPGESERPTFRVFDKPQDTYRPGVWFFGIGKDGGLTDIWVCSPIHVEAVTFDESENNFGRLLRFKNTVGRWREWAMPMEMLKGDGSELRGELLAMGVEIDPGQKARNLLATFLQSQHPERRVRCAIQVGWCSNSFVLPDVVIGPEANEIIFQSCERGHEEFTTGGTLDGWREGIAKLAVGNPLLILALSAAFAGPILKRCNAEGGGLHFVGDSSVGKTTLIEAACSVWGGPNFRRSWRTTANGLEGAAVLFNDTLLALDEINEADPREVGAIVYALGNGRGKQRATRTGAARPVHRWRCMVLSSGERTIAAVMDEAGRQIKAGQSIRVLDVPVARAYGAFDALHGFPDGRAFADTIKTNAAAHFGHAGRAFLERLTRDTRDLAEYRARIAELPAFTNPSDEGQERRAAGRFALVALAGELATEYGITGWPEGAAVEAAALGLRLWREARGGGGNTERRQVLEQVSAFLERHGDSRFSSMNDDDTVVRDRAGWWTDSPKGRTFLFTAAGLREALRGHDFRRALDVLEAAGALPKSAQDGKRARPYRIGGRVLKLYPVNPERLEAGNEP